MVIGISIGLSSWIYKNKYVHISQFHEHFSARLEEITDELVKYTLQSKNNKEKLEKIAQELFSWKINMAILILTFQ